jgi:endoglucanase
MLRLSRLGRNRRLVTVVVVVGLAIALAAVALRANLVARSAPSGQDSATSSPAHRGLWVRGNQLMAGQASIQLAGVNRSGTEYSCIQGKGIFDGPSDAASVQAIASWHANIVRIPLNEDCWLGINGVSPAYGGTSYQRAIDQYVRLLHQNGMYAELSLMWGAPGAYPATYQPNAPDADHSPALWASLAAAFAEDSDVILAPWGETTVGWACFRDGCSDQATYGTANAPYQTVGMQQAVTVMRAAGYQGVISIPCIYYANRCANYNNGSWLQYEPTDPNHQLIAEAHVYGKNACDNPACLSDDMSDLAARVPVIFGETGETYDASECTSRYVQTLLSWADVQRPPVGYMAWTWNTWNNCSALISSYDGTPNTTAPPGAAYGKYVRDHLAHLPQYPRPSSAPAATRTATFSPAP